MLNKEKRELVIGLLLEDIGSEFSKNLVMSTVNSVSYNKNVLVIVLPGKYNNEDNDINVRACKAVQNSVFELSRICRFDGFVIHLGGNKEEFEHHIQLAGSQKTPRVFIGIDSDELVTVNYDNAAGISEAVNYLVNICGMTRLCMLGGRSDNKDASLRKDVFARCLKETGLSFEESNFINTDMTDSCTAEAERLLDDNPDVQAVFCVNDAAAKALYEVMEERELVPGRDIMVFGFDNTNMSGELTPPLSSIGASIISLGQKATEMIIGMANGDEVSSELVPTRLYGRASLPYEMYDYNSAEMENIESGFIYRMFDDCFYRYRNEYRSSETIDLKRLFYEFISQMLTAMNRRYMSLEKFDELCSLVDIFFENGAVRYTDAEKLIQSINKIQAGMNEMHRSANMNLMVNRLFLRMKDKALLSFASELSQNGNSRNNDLNNLCKFTTDCMAFDETKQTDIEKIITNIPKLGIRNAAFYMFEEPVVCKPDSPIAFPDKILMKCVVRSGKTRLIPKQRQQCAMSDMFSRYELPKSSAGMVVFPVFNGSRIYGFLLCGCEGDIYDKGEYISIQLGKELAGRN